MYLVDIDVCTRLHMNVRKFYLEMGFALLAQGKFSCIDLFIPFVAKDNCTDWQTWLNDFW